MRNVAWHIKKVEWLAVSLVRNRRVGLLWGLMEATFSKPHAALWRCGIYL
jgi:hypothetical protein